MRWVEIEFDCLPLRSVGRLDPPLDASPAWRDFCQRVADAVQRHGAHNTYYLHQGVCRYHLANSSETGVVEFQFEGTVLTDETDEKTASADLRVSLGSETCPWLTEPIVRWFQDTVSRAVEIEFDRYIAAGDLAKARQRMERVQQMVDEQGGYLGMYL